MDLDLHYLLLEHFNDPPKGMHVHPGSATFFDKIR